MSTTRRDISPYDDTDVWETGDLGAPAQGDNPIKTVHRALRGRYVIATTIGVILGLAGAAAGMKSQHPEYTSRATINVQPNREIAMYDDVEQKLSTSAFEAFVQQEASQLGSRRVMEAAQRRILNDPTSKKLDWPDTQRSGVIKISDSISVSVPKRTNQIILTATNRSSTAAFLIATHVMGAYRELYESEIKRQWQDRMNTLDNLKQDIEGQLSAVNRSLMTTYSSTGGEVGFEKAYTESRTEYLDLNRQLLSVQLERARLTGNNSSSSSSDASSGGRAGTADASADPAPGSAAPAERAPAGFELTDTLLQTLASTDETLAGLVRERDDIERRIAIIEPQATPKHRQLQRLKNQLASVSLLIESRASSLHGSGAGSQNGPTSPASVAAQYDEMERLLQKRIDVLQDRIKRYDDIRSRSANDEVERGKLQQQLDEVNDRIRKLTTEQNASKNRELVDKLEFGAAEEALKPSGDKSKQFAAAGFMAGFGGTYAAFIAFGLAFPRLRSGDDVFATVSSDVNVLGMIPELSQDGEQRVIAHECVHLLRTMIEANESVPFPVLAITSPVAGAGKSTVAQMLAESYSASGKRVLLIDADLTGRGLTARLGLDGHPGLSDRNTHTARELAVPVNEHGLHVIGGGTQYEGVAPMSRSRIQELIESAYDDFDLAIVDTGPILGSVEAASIAPIADRVLLVASRGMESKLLQVAVERLAGLRAKRVGIVFNRARPFDIVRSVSAQSTAQLRSRINQTAVSRPAAPATTEDGAG